MRILHVITSLNIGGAEKLMVDLLPRLKQKGNYVELCVFNGKRTTFYDQLEQAGIRVIDISVGQSVYNPILIYRLLKLIKKERYDIVHTHNTAPQIFASICGFFTSIALCTTEHNTSNRRREWKWYKFIDRWMYRKYKHIISISDATEVNLRKYIGETSGKITTIYNGIDVSKFEMASPTDRSTLVPPSHHVIMMVAAFREQKDQDTVIRAIKLLPLEYELFLVGDGERRPKIEEIIKDLDLNDRVHLLGLRSDVPSLLKAADVVVLSSHWEGFGLVAAEGMAAGKPVIATNVDGLSQVVGGYGILFPQGEAEALANEILQITTDEQYKMSVSNMCQERAKQFDISTMVEKYYEVYEGLMG